MGISRQADPPTGVIRNWELVSRLSSFHLSRFSLNLGHPYGTLMYLIRFNPALPCQASLRPSLRDFYLQFYTIHSALFSLCSTHNFKSLYPYFPHFLFPYTYTLIPYTLYIIPYTLYPIHYTIIPIFFVFCF